MELNTFKHHHKSICKALSSASVSTYDTLKTVLILIIIIIMCCEKVFRVPFGSSGMPRSPVQEVTSVTGDLHEWYSHVFTAVFSTAS